MPLISLVLYPWYLWRNGIISQEFRNKYRVVSGEDNIKQNQRPVASEKDGSSRRRVIPRKNIIQDRWGQCE